MKLWTLHCLAFSLTGGRVDHEQSKYYEKPEAKEAYPKLWHLIGRNDGQIIWCYLSNEGIPKTGIEMTLYELEVPQSKIIAFVDDIVWNKILGYKPGLPSIERRWRNEAIEKSPENRKAHDKYVEERYKELWIEPPPSGDHWNELIVTRPCELVSAVIAHPVPKEMLLNSTPWVL